MNYRPAHMMSVACAFLIALASRGFLVAEEGPMVATVGEPAVVTATVAPSAEQGVAGQSLRVIISITGFTPPHDGAVQAVVKAQAGGGRTEQEIGRFGMFPNTEFKAADPSKAHRFGLPLPKELAESKDLKLHIYLVPLRGDGSGALLELGTAEIR